MSPFPPLPLPFTPQPVVAAVELMTVPWQVIAIATMAGIGIGHWAEQRWFAAYEGGRKSVDQWWRDLEAGNRSALGRGFLAYYGVGIGTSAFIQVAFQLINLLSHMS